MSEPGLREKNRLATRHDLLTAAFSLIRERGYDQTSVEAICERAGVSRATFFNYFPQKDLLLTEVASQRLGQLREFIASQKEWQSPPSFEGLIELFGELCRQNEKILDVAPMLMSQALAQPGGRARIAQFRAEAVGLIADYISPLLPPGEAHQDPRLLAETAFAIYFGTMLEFVTSATAKPGQLTIYVMARLRLILPGAPR